MSKGGIMSSRQTTKSYFLTLDGTISDKKIKTNKDDVITMRIQKVPNDVALEETLETSDSLVCNVEIHPR